MKKFVPLLLSFLFSIGAGAQLISRFTWEASPATQSAFGPNAISVSSYATVSSGGTNDTKGLNPGGQYDINLVLDGTSFNVPAIDISVDFRREESQASFFYRGTNFNFGMNGGHLSVNFSLLNGVVVSSVNSGNIYAVPDDHLFHNYHFTYDNNTGIAKVLVDAAVVYTYNGTAGLPLYWTGAGNVTIGKDMDATGRNLAVLDNLVVQQYASALLPLQLLSFNVAAKSKFASVEFTTTQEIHVTSFIIERSANGSNFSPLTSITASNGYSSVNHYQFIDSMPYATTSYYRLKILNSDGSFHYSAVQTISFKAGAVSEVAVYPNPAIDYITVKMSNAAAGRYSYTVSSIAGLAAISGIAQLAGGQEIKLDLTRTGLHGIIVITLRNSQTGAAESFPIIRK